jgi:hypothetical protein
MYRAKGMFLETVVRDAVAENRVRCCADEIVVLLFGYDTYDANDTYWAKFFPGSVGLPCPIHLLNPKF